MSINWTDGRVVTWRHDDPWQELLVLAENLDMICGGFLEHADADTISDDLDELITLISLRDEMQYALDLIDEIGSLVFPGYRLARDEAGDWRFLEVK